jgi:hypothetical protein
MCSHCPHRRQSDKDISPRTKGHPEILAGDLGELARRVDLRWSYQVAFRAELFDLEDLGPGRHVSTQLTVGNLEGEGRIEVDKSLLNGRLKRR